MSLKGSAILTDAMCELELVPERVPLIGRGHVLHSETPLCESLLPV